MNMVVWFSRIVEIAADRKKFTPKDNEMSNVILGVLEAAGKVDKEHTEQFLTIWNDLVGGWPTGTRGRARDVISQLRALLEALPEKEKERG